MFPEARSGRPGHFRLARAGSGAESSLTLRSGSSLKSWGATGAVFLRTASTSPITWLGR